MITVVPVGGGTAAVGVAADYYLQRRGGCEHELDGELQQPNADRAGYYLDGRSPVGRWIGRGATSLGLAGGLSRDGEEAFRELLAGRLAGEQLSRPVLRYDADGQPRDVRRAAYDVTLSAPKSVSVLLALGDPSVAEQVRQAHAAAVADAIGLLEQLSARAARGHHGDGQRAARIGTDGVIGVAFEHQTSRADDPQLHTHVVLMNLTRGVDGRWSALDSRTLFAEATTASYLYQYRLRAELTARLGVGWEPLHRGVAEVRGVPLSVRRLFSTRRRQIESALAGRDIPTPGDLADRQPGRDRTLRAGVRRAAQAACLATRPAKTHTAGTTLRETWAARANAIGFGPAELSALLDRRQPAVQVDVRALAAKVLSADGVTREASTFGQGTVLRELCQHLPGGAQLSSDQLQRLARRLVQTDEVVPVVTDTGPAYTTTDLLRIEQHALRLAADGRAPHSHLPVADAATALARSELRPDQARVVAALLSSGRGVDVLTGPAGSGKTAALRLATQQWQQAGLPVAGTAVAALTAHGLQQATGAESVSLARLLHHPDRHLPDGGVLLVDEAGMIGTRSLHQLLQLANDRHCKLVLVGDPAQLPELEAGGLFPALASRLDTLCLAGHHRQQHPWEQQALAALRTGRIEQALDAYEQHGQLHTHSDSEQLRTQLVTDYLGRRARSTDPFQVLVLAGSRRDVSDLNDRIRTRLTQQGRLGDRTLTVTDPQGEEREYRAGDQVLITRNDHQRGVLNGTTGTVTDIGDRGMRLTLTDGRTVDLDHAWLRHGHLDHAYALTVHKAQGRTVTHALLLSSESATRELGYVGMSRGTSSNQLYLEHTDRSGDQGTCATRPPWTPPQPAEKARRLSRSGRQQLASQYPLRPRQVGGIER